MDKLEANKIFNREYNKLTDKERDDFAEICNKLLTVNYIVSIQENYSDLDFIKYKEVLFINYFAIIDYNFRLDRTKNQMAFISNDIASNRLKLKRNDSLVLLMLRKFFQEKSDEISLSNYPSVSFGELLISLNNLSLSDGKVLTATEIKNSLSILRRYNIVSYISKNLVGQTRDEERITIYPSILIAANFREMSEVLEKIATYGGNSDEENDED